MEPIADGPPDEWDNVMAINLGSVVHCIRAVLFASDEASYCNGAQLTIDGGMTAKML